MKWPSIACRQFRQCLKLTIRNPYIGALKNTGRTQRRSDMIIYSTLSFGFLAWNYLCSTNLLYVHFGTIENAVLVVDGYGYVDTVAGASNDVSAFAKRGDETSSHCSVTKRHLDLLSIAVCNLTGYGLTDAPHYLAPGSRQTASSATNPFLGFDS